MTYQVESVPLNTNQGYSENQICQWYCCACGQSYGSIIYRDHAAPEPTPVSDSASTPSQSLPSLNDYLLQSLKHYSLMIYNHPSLPTDDDANYTTDSPVRYTSSPETASGSPVLNQRIALKVPTRFTCHRCDHMMCPYCPKVRIKDLANP